MSEQWKGAWIALLLVFLHVLNAGAETINPRSHVTKILQDKSGMVWFATWNGLVRYDGNRQTTFKPKAGDGSGITNDRIRNIVLADDGNILCRFDEQVYVFDLKSYSFRCLPEKEAKRAMTRLTNKHSLLTPYQELTINGTTYSNIRQDFKDSQGNRWLMFDSEIVRIPVIARHGERINQLASDVIRDIYRDRDGRIWIAGRDKHQLALFDKSLSLIGYLGKDGMLHPEQTDFAPVYTIFQDKDGYIWLGTKPEGIFRLKPRSGGKGYDIEHIGKSNATLFTDSPYGFAQDKKGRLWVASNRDGLLYIDNPNAANINDLHGVSLQKATKSFPADAARMRKLLIMDDGTLLATTTMGLLVVDNIYKPTNQLTMRLHTREAENANSLSSSALMNIVSDAAHNVFIGTESGGVNMLTSKDIHAEHLTFKHFSEANGLEMDVAQGLLMLADGRLLVQCSYGISVINSSNGTIDNYGMNFWNASSAFSDCNPLMLDDGRLLFGMTDGLLLLPYNQLSQQGFKPRIALTSLSLNGSETNFAIDNMETITLSPSQRDLTLSFAALDYRAVEPLLYRIRMSPDEPWSAPLPTNELVLQDLSPGTYTLQICSSNADAQWSDNVRTLTIIVQPTFFEAWYGILFLIVLGMIIVSAITYTLFYIRNINHERNQTREAYLSLMAERNKERAKAEEQSAATGVAVEPAEPVIVSSLSEEDEAFMNRLMTFVEQNIGNSDANVNDMAEATATSRSGLARRMHSLLGVTPADFLREARLKRAAQMLTDTRKTNSEIAYACGFSDPKYFAKTFKTKFGKSPREYREEGE